MPNPREAVYRTIRAKLLEGGLSSPKEISRQRLASALETSPTIVQWALARLEGENVLEVRPSSGTRVRQLTPAEFLRLHDLRILLEPYAAARAARHRTAALLKSLEQTLRERTALDRELQRGQCTTLPADNLERGIRLEYRFHAAIAESARHPEVAHQLGNLFIPLLAYSVGQSVGTITVAEWVDGNRRTEQGHRTVLEAIRRRDPAAARDAMRRHLATDFQGRDALDEHSLIDCLAASDDH